MGEMCPTCHQLKPVYHAVGRFLGEWVLPGQRWVVHHPHSSGCSYCCCLLPPSAPSLPSTATLGRVPSVWGLWGGPTRTTWPSRSCCTCTIAQVFFCSYDLAHHELCSMQSADGANAWAVPLCLGRQSSSLFRDPSSWSSTMTMSECTTGQVPAPWKSERTTLLHLPCDSSLL